MTMNAKTSLLYTTVILCIATCAGECLTKLHTSSNNINRFYKVLEFSVFNHLLKGDCSLELKNVRPEDAGVYESFLLVGGKNKWSLPKSVFIQSVELSVEETPEEDVSDRVAVADDAGVNCHYPQIIALSILSSSLFHLF
ncbi:hypothetical protein SRHO_G00099060 [Serrasalmus rhombeus]